MSWIQLRWQLRSEQVASAESLLSDHGAVALVLESLADEVVLEPDPGATPMWTEVYLKAFFSLDLDVAALGLALRSHDPDVHDHCEFDFVAEQDWQTALQQHALPQEFAGRLRLLPKSAVDDAEPSDAACLYLDPGLAFGSGSHPTTRMCVSWMAREVQAGQHVLDFGCGSGILAIAAVLMGATAVGVDHDEQAVLATTDNAHFNGIDATRLKVVSLAEWQRQLQPGESFDVVAANILAGPLQQLAQHFCALLAPQGHVVLSGILPEQCSEVMLAYPQIDFVEPVIEDGWACLIGVKRR